MLSDEQVIDILKALADPNRLRLFELLLASDRTNSELMDETGLRQNLLSHHLTILTDCALVNAHKSIGDARRHYYSANLLTTRDFHHWWELRSPPDHLPFASLKQPKHVLFLCRRNSVRSLIAEALARYLAAGALIPASAGMEGPEDPIPAMALRVLDEHGVPHDSLSMQLYTDVIDIPFDYVITVCDIVHEGEIPPEFATAHYIHWSLVDPSDVADDEAGRLAATRELFDDIRLRLAYFVRRLIEDEVNAGNS